VAKSSPPTYRAATSRKLLPEGQTISERLIDLLRQGKVPEVIRRKGAEGTLPLPTAETIEVLVFLAGDPDDNIRTTAYLALQTWKTEELNAALSDPAAPIEVLEFAANQMVSGRKEMADAMLANSALPRELRDRIQRIAAQEQKAPADASPPEPEPPVPGAEKEGERITLLQRIGRMSAAEKIKAALTGNQEERLLLIRDSNKIVARAVLQSPKLSDMEIENYASMKNVTEEVLRLIAMNRKFMKSYSVMRQLVNNPRTPIDVSLPMLNRLNERDLKGLMINKNVAEVLRGMAQKMIKQKEEANKPKLPGKKH